MPRDDDSLATHPTLTTSADERWSAPPGCALTRQDIDLFGRGVHSRLYEKLGCHRASVDGREGFSFAVWAPNAERVSVVGSFNDWNANSATLAPVGRSGIWAGFRSSGAIDGSTPA